MNTALNKHLNLVILEDNEADLQLVIRELYKNGVSVRFKRVETKSQFLGELNGTTPDLVLSDHGYPSFDGFTALSLTQQLSPHTPFIFVTGSLNESLAIEAFRRGASDYVLKNRLSDLTPAIERVFQKPQKDSESSSGEQSIADKPMITACASCKQIRTREGTWISLEEFLEETYGVVISHGFCQSCMDELYPRRLRRSSA